MLNAEQQIPPSQDPLKQADAYRRLIDKLDQPVFVHRNFKILFANDACVGLFGFASPDDMLRVPDIQAIVGGGDGCLLGSATRSTAPFSLPPEPRKVRGQTVNGEAIWLKIKVEDIDWGGEEATLCMVTSIEAPVAPDAGMQFSAQGFDFIAEQLSAVLMCVDRDGRYVYVNKSFEEWCGRPKSEILGRTGAEIVDPEIYRKFLPHAEAALAGEARNVESAITYPDGRERVVSLFYTPDVDERGQVRGYIVLGHDISELRTVEEALVRSEKRAREIIASHRDAILIVDKEGMTTFANPAAEQILGRTSDQLVGTELGIPLTGEGIAEIDIAGEPMRKAELQASPLEWDGDTAFLVSIRDVTERKTFEENERRLREQLTHAARVSAVGDMAAGLAHEINQPLTAISIYVQTCIQLLRMETPDQERLGTTLQKVVDQVTRASDIVNWLRSVVKKEEVAKAEVDLNAIIQEVSNFLGPQIKASEAEVTLALNESLPQFKAHKVQLQQVVLNLIQNSLEAVSDLPEPRRRISVETSLLDDGRVHVEVKDSGPGIPSDVQNNVFSAFFTTKQAGLGLGLSISKSIVEYHHGDLSVASIPGKGTTFSIILPTT